MPVIHMSLKIEENLLRFNKIEPYYFYLFLVIHLIPVLSFQFFPTVDGPAHLYNSNLMVELIKNSSSPLHDFFVFNKSIHPNWSGHFLLSLFAWIFPGFIAEKLVLLIYLIGFPVGMRYLFKTLSIENKYLLYLVFPFTYSFLFFYGFYNFNIGLVFFLFGISLWIKYKNSPDIKKCIVLFIFSSLICLSHLFVFAVFLLVIFLLNIQHIFSKKTGKVNYFKNILLQLLILSIGLVLMVKYLFFSAPNHQLAVYLPWREILGAIQDVMPAKGIHYGKAGTFTKWIFYIFVAYIIYLPVAKIYARLKKKDYIIKNKLWLWTAFIVFILTFLVPDNTGSVGFITARFILFFFIFLMVGLASQKVAFWLRICVFIIINYISIALILHNYQSIAKDCRIAEEIYDVSKNMEPNSVVLPIVNSNNFIHAHISNYLGADKPLVVLENYEASLDYFPLKWNYAKVPSPLIEWYSNNDQCKAWKCINSQYKRIDYVFILDDQSESIDASCLEKINEVLKLHYTESYISKNGMIKLFKLNASAR